MHAISPFILPGDAPTICFTWEYTPYILPGWAPIIYFTCRVHAIYFTWTGIHHLFYREDAHHLFYQEGTHHLFYLDKHPSFILPRGTHHLFYLEGTHHLLYLEDTHQLFYLDGHPPFMLPVWAPTIYFTWRVHTIYFPGCVSRPSLNLFFICLYATCAFCNFCLMQFCKGSLCSFFNKTACECKASSKKCVVCCKGSDAETCTPLANQTKMPGLRLTLLAGTYCNKGKGTCNQFNRCRIMDEFGSLLSNFSLSIDAVRDMWEWARKNWIFALFGVAGILALFGIIVKFGARSTQRSIALRRLTVQRNMQAGERSSGKWLQ